MRWALGSLLLALAHHSSCSARRNSRRMLISEAPTASEYVNVQEGRQGRQIQPLACVSKSGGEKGVCMFAWNCVEAGGQHLGTCIDRFYFGSCCKLGGNKPSSGGSQGGSDAEKGELAEDILDNEIPDDVLVPVKATTSSTTTTTTTVTITTSTSIPPTTPTTSTTTTTTTTTTNSSSTTTSTTTSSSTTTTTTTTPSTTTTTTTTTKQTTTNTSQSPVSSSTTKSSLLVTVTEDIATTVTDESTFTTIEEELSTTDETSTVTEEVASTEETTLSPDEETTLGSEILPPISTFATDIVFPTETTTNVGEDLFSEDEYVTDSYDVDTDGETSTPSAPQETSTSPIESVNDTTTEDSEQVTTTENVEDVTTVGNTEETSTVDDLEEATTSSDSEVTVVTEVVDEETTEEPVVIIEPPDEIEFPQSSEDGCKDNWVAVHIGPDGQPNAVGGLGGCVAKPGQYFNCSDTVITEGVYNCTVVDGPSPPGPSPPEEEACRTLSDPLKIKECLDSFSTDKVPTTETTTEKVATTPQQSEPVDEGNNKTTETPTRLQTGWPDLSTMPFREICGHRPWLNQTFRRSAQATPRGGRMIGGQRTTKEMHGLWGGQHNRRGKIVNGEDAKYGEWPWQVSLRQWRTATFLHKCGAALLSENWAITAAHCVESVNPDELLLRMGEFDLNDEEHEPFTFQDRKVQIVASHPKFDPKTFEYDLALLRFYEPVVFTPNIIPVCIPEDDEDLVGRDAWVTGWGRLYEDGPLPSKMQKVTLPIINNTECELMYEKAGFREHIPHIFICAGYREGGKDSCEGDSGGPMSVQRQDDGRFMLSGVISWGIGCAEKNQPGVYTRISDFREWINQILQY